MENYPHLSWQRIEHEPVGRQPGRPPLGGPAVRPHRREHAEEIARDEAQAIADQQRRRIEHGIDPSKLLVLEFGFLEASQREHLGRIGVQVLNEEETREDITPEYTLSVGFGDAASLRDFRQDQSLASCGIVGHQAERGPGGDAHPKRLTLVFDEEAAREAFQGNDELLARLRIVQCRWPAKRSRAATHRLLVQFPDEATLDRFRREREAYEEDAPDELRETEVTGLTVRMRKVLFDALESVRRLSREDRMGPKLASQGVPAGQETFYLDVDLWHPGDAALMAEAIRQFDDYVAETAGDVTDGPHPVAGTLLLARVRGSRDTLEALLEYDRVARVDLPPEVSGSRLPWDAEIVVPDELPPVPDDGPLACVVDSGIVSGHPLLRGGIVVDERDFDSGEDDAVDRVGHGTHVAGIVVYGDFHEALQAGQWVPRVRLLSAKVMKRSGNGGEGRYTADFSDNLRVETQLGEAIRTFADEYGCRVFNLSIGNADLPVDGKRQLPWAYLLDDLARELDLVIVVSAGNVMDPDIPVDWTRGGFQEHVREQLLTDSHRIIDPASAANVLTVGAIARNDTPTRTQQDPGQRILPGAWSECPSPFTRAGMVEKSSPSCVRRAVKPELAAYAGNLSWDPGLGNWRRNDRALAEPSLRHDWPGNRLICFECGTSVAAPYVAHIAARVEAELRWTLARAPSANLIRALVVHSASVSDRARNWIAEGRTDAEAEVCMLRLVGYGKPDPARALYSSDNRAVLVAEDEVEENQVHMYELELPPEFYEGRGRRRIRITLAYDPPVRGTRQEYISRTMSFKVYRGLATETLRIMLSKKQRPEGHLVQARPTETLLEWSTVQSRVVEGTEQRKFEHRAGGEAPVLWHILVECHKRFDVEQTPSQRYALVLSLEDEDEQVQLYQAVRQRIRERVRIAP